MRKALLLASATLMIGASSLSAQNVSVNEENIKKKLAKADEQVNNPKKAGKAATWISRGDVYVEAAMAPSVGWREGMGTQDLLILFGEPKEQTQGVIGKIAYVKMIYPHVTGYIQNDVVKFWEEKEILPNALEVAFESYKKAYEIDASAKGKVTKGYEEVANAYKQKGQNYFGLQEVLKAADAFRSAYNVQKTEPLNVIDTLSIYNAGYVFALSEKYEDGKECLEQSVEYGYYDEGEAFHLLFYCYYSLGMIEQADQILMKGLDLYPSNKNIITSLVGLYVSTPDKNPEVIVDKVENALKSDDKNSELWLSLGRIYNNMKQHDKAIEAFKTAVSLEPESYLMNLNLGYEYLVKADAMVDEMNANPSMSTGEFNRKREEAMVVYEQSVGPLEMAFEANKEGIEAVELLKNVTIRLMGRNAEIDKKAEKYGELFNKMQ